MKNQTNRPSNVVAYLRTNNADSSKANSLESQIMYMHDWLTENNAKLQNVFIDNSVSGVRAEPSGRQRLLEFVLQHKDTIDAVVVYDLNRLSRDVYTLAKVESILADQGINLIVMNANSETEYENSEITQSLQRTFDQYLNTMQ